MSVFIKKGHFCVIQKNPVEIPEQYVHRGYSIISQYPQNQSEFDKYVNTSNFLNNIKFLGCSYCKKIDDLCIKMEENIFNK